jgi:transcriptional regulator with XRE-family HTH domain
LQAELRRIRKEAGLSQVELALRIHKPQSYVSKYENGERKLYILELREICKALRISIIGFAEQLDRALKVHEEVKG